MNIRKIHPLFLISACLFTSFVFASCVSTAALMSKLSTTQLVDKWLTSNNRKIRASIIEELNDRQDFKGLTACLKNAAYVLDKDQHTYTSLISIQDIIPIIQAVGRFKNSETIDDLLKFKAIPDPKIHLAILETLEQINDPKIINQLTVYLNHKNTDIKMKALAILASMTSIVSSNEIIPLLFDENPLIRWKALHVLGKINDPKSIDKIRLLLSDEDKSVRDSAEHILRQLGVPTGQISLWKEKANEINFDEISKTRLAYEKAVLEKTELQEKINSLEEGKLQLEGTLQERSDALKAKETSLSAIYEKDQQLNSKNKQLELYAQQSKGYLDQVSALNKKVIELNLKINNQGQTESTAKLKNELDSTIRKKEKYENEIQSSKNKETALKNEISELENLTKKARIEARNAQIQVEKMADREADLLKELDNLRIDSQQGTKPVVLISVPYGNAVVEAPYLLLDVFAVDDKGIENIAITVNGLPVNVEITRGIKQKIDKTEALKIHFKQRLSLILGLNIVKVKVTDTNGLSVEEIITITRKVEKGQVFAAIIGINDYQAVRDLRYAVNDAKAFKDYLQYNIGIPEKNLFYFIDQDATKENLQKLLGTHLKRKVSKEDTVFIFFAGHGAVESDPENPDGDGFEKYLLPHDADLNDLYTSSISMDEIRKIFQRIRSDRIIFIVDSCYSGASGGRTILTNASRANLSDKFMERISKSKGRIIISSCAANEVSQENDKYEHGLFSYYFLKGLKGEADFDHDGLITVSEIFGYVSKTVPSASGQDQHPVKRGESEGQLIIGKIK